MTKYYHELNSLSSPKVQEEHWKKKELNLLDQNTIKEQEGREIVQDAIDYDDITQNAMYIYQQPLINKGLWKTRPRPYVRR